MAILLVLYVVLLYVAIRYPYIMLMILILGSRFGDNNGLGMFFAGNVFPYHDTLISGLTFISSVICTYYFFYREKCFGLNPTRCAILVGAAYLFGGWILISSLFAGKPIGFSVSQMLMCQGYVIPIVLRYSRSRKFRIAILTCVGIQLFFAVMILLVPVFPFNLMATARYRSSWSGPETFQGMALYFGNRKLAAQFYNANAYGFYATSALALSFMALYLIKKRWLSLTVFSTIFALALFGVIATVGRGCILGLVTGCTLALIGWLRVSRLKSVPISIGVTFALLFFAGITLAARDPQLREIFLPGGRRTSLESRSSAVSESLRVIAANPLLGNADPESIEITAHVTPLFYAEVYGLVAGSTPMLMILLVAGAYLVVVVNRRRIDPATAVVPYWIDLVAGMVGIGMWLSNGAGVGGGVMNWVVITLAVVPWTQTPVRVFMKYHVSGTRNVFRPQRRAV